MGYSRFTFHYLFQFFLFIHLTWNIYTPQTEVKRSIQYNQITNFETNQSIGNVKMSADGSKIIFATGGQEKKIFTINSDGTGLTQIYSFPITGHTPHIDIDAKGERIIWCDWVGEGEIFTSNSDGSVQNKIVTLLPNPNPILADMKPNITSPPRLTADGGEVYFIHNHPDTYADGIWSVRTNGTNLKQVFNFVELAIKAFDNDLSDLTEPWSGYLNKFDISANADKIYVGTNYFKIRNGDIDRGNLSVYANGTYYRLGEYAVGTKPFATNNEGGECIVFRREYNSTLEHDEINVYFDTPGTGDPIRIISGLNIFGTPKMLQMTGTSGAVVLADNGRLPITFVERVYKNRLDLVSIDGISISTLGGFRFSHSDYPSINWSGDRFCFLTSTAPAPQIWVADIGSDAVNANPSISEVSFNPDFVMIDGSTSSTFKTHVNSPPFDIFAVTFDTFKDGAYHFRALTSEWPSWGLLLDNGEFGDENADEGFFTNNTIRRDFTETPLGN